MRFFGVRPIEMVAIEAGWSVFGYIKMGRSLHGRRYGGVHSFRGQP
jgi:hypothetical protein